jgi:hypothetical protein
MFFGKLWLRIKGELLAARDTISAKNDTLKNSEELLDVAKQRLQAFLTDSPIQEDGRTAVHDPATAPDQQVTGEPKTGREGQTHEQEQRASNPRTLG